MRRDREDEEPMNREEIRVMAAKQEVWVATAAAANRIAGIVVTPPPLPTPRQNLSAYQPYPQNGRPPAPTPEPSRGGGVCYNFYQLGHQKATCPYAQAASIGGPPARGGRGGARGGRYAQKPPRAPAPQPPLPPPSARPPLQPRGKLPSTQGAKCENCGKMHHMEAQCRSRPSTPAAAATTPPKPPHLMGTSE